MTRTQLRLKNLEAVLTDPMGLIPHSQKWLEHWDRQFRIYMTGQDRKALWHSSIECRAVMKHAEESPVSLVRRGCEGEQRL